MFHGQLESIGHVDFICFILKRDFKSRQQSFEVGNGAVVDDDQKFSARHAFTARQALKCQLNAATVGLDEPAFSQQCAAELAGDDGADIADTGML